EVRGALDLEVVEQRLEHGDLVLEGQRLRRALALRETRAQPVVADDAITGRERFDEAAKRGLVPVLDDVADPPGRQDERRPGADRRVRDPPPLEAQEAGLLRHVVRLRVFVGPPRAAAPPARRPRLPPMPGQAPCTTAATISPTGVELT